MLSLTVVGASGINDPNFLYILGAQILFFIIVCLAVGWVIYKLLGKHRSNIKEPYKIIATVIIVIVAICVAGYISELTGL